MMNDKANRDYHVTMMYRTVVLRYRIESCILMDKILSNTCCLTSNARSPILYYPHRATVLLTYSGQASYIASLQVKASSHQG